MGSANKVVHEVKKPLFSASGSGPSFQQVEQPNDITNCPVAALPQEGRKIRTLRESGFSQSSHDGCLSSLATCPFLRSWLRYLKWAKQLAYGRRTRLLGDSYVCILGTAQTSII